MQIVWFSLRNAKVLRDGGTRHSCECGPPGSGHSRSGLEIQGSPDTETAFEGR